MIVASLFFSFAFMCVCVCVFAHLFNFIRTSLENHYGVGGGGGGGLKLLKLFIGHCHSQLLFQDTQQSVTCVLYQTDNILISSGAMDG